MSVCLSSSLVWYPRFIIKRDYLKPILQYAEGHAGEDSAVMAAILHLVQVCCTSSCGELNVYIQTKVEECDRFRHVGIVEKLMSSKKRARDVSNESAKFSHLE